VIRSLIHSLHASRSPFSQAFDSGAGLLRMAIIVVNDRVRAAPDHDLMCLFEHDLQANASRLSRGETGTHFLRIVL
jgi:hypothetical protein